MELIVAIGWSTHFLVYATVSVGLENRDLSDNVYSSSACRGDQHSVAAHSILTAQ